MKTTLILSLLCFPFFGSAQIFGTNKLQIGVNVSPNYSYRNLRYSQNLENIVADREANEFASGSYNFGLFARYKILPKFEAEVGLQYANQSNRFKDVTVTNPYAQPIGKCQIRDNFNFIELPVRINYKFFTKEKFVVYSTIGSSLNFFLYSNSKVNFAYDDGTEIKEKIRDTTTSFNRSSISFLFGIGLGYQLTEKYHLRFEPILRYSLLPLADTQILQYNYTIGGQVSISMPL